MTKLTLKKPLSAETQEKLMKLKEAPSTGSTSLKSEENSSTKMNNKAQPQKSASPKEAQQPVSGKPPRQKGSSQTPEEIAQIALEKFESAKAWLEATFPATFDFVEPKPLKLNIDKDLSLLLPDKVLSKSQVKRALKKYVQNESYLKSLLEHGWRYDLSGARIEEVQDAHKDYARKKLANGRPLTL